MIKADSNNQDRITLGLISQGGEGWMGGIVYLHNLIRSLALLPVEERPQACLLLDSNTKINLYNELGANLPIVRHFVIGKGVALRTRLKAQIKSALKGAWASDLESILKRDKVDVIFPAFSPLKKEFHFSWIGWIADFRHKRYPDTISKEEIARRDIRHAKLIQSADHMIVSSQDAYSDLMRWFKTDEGKVSIYRFTVVPTDSWYMPDPRQVCRTLGLPEKFLFYPAQFWKHKNHLNLFKAMTILREKGLEDVSLVLTGKDRDYYVPGHAESLKKYILDNGLTKNIHYLGLIEREKVVQLMRCSAAIVQPSYFEGWGLLIEEARALGKKIYLSDIPIHREQNHPHAVYFDPDKPEKIAEAIAVDWKKLELGPNLFKESQARREVEKLAVGYARNFMDIIRKVIQEKRVLL